VYNFVTKGGRGFAVAALPGQLVANESTGGKPIQYPACRPREAYRAAVASGAPRVPAELHYNQLGGAPEWTFWVQGRPDAMRRMDGRSCAIKWKPGR
jgi:hypothetical protein